MQDVTAFLSAHWEATSALIVALVGGGLAIRWRIQRHSGSSSYSDQRSAKAGGDIVGRDKTTKN